MAEKLGTRLRRISNRSILVRDSAKIKQMLMERAGEGHRYLVIKDGYTSKEWDGIYFNGGWEKWARSNGLRVVNQAGHPDHEAVLQTLYDVKPNFDVLLAW